MEHLILNEGSDSAALAKVALEALREARTSKTSNSGSIFVSDGQTDADGIALGTGTLINGVDGGIQPWVGDTTAPGKPTGITAESHNGAIWVSWDGTLEGGIPADFDHVQFTAVDGSKTVDMGRLSAAGKVTAAELTAGDTVVVTAVAFDDAHDAQGNSKPNASPISDAVPVIIQSAVSAEEVQAIQSDLSKAQSDIAAEKSSMTDLTKTVSTVDGKSTTSGSAPTTDDASGKPEGAMWYVMDANGNLTGTYVLKSGAWVKYAWASSSIADEVNKAISDAASKASTAQSTADAAKSAAETNANDLTSFINETTDNLSSLQSQVDGSITTWFYGVAPTTSNQPASDWTTTDLKNNHLGDLYYDTVTGYCYRYQVANNTYSWARISDVDVTKALSDAAKAQDTADAKRRVFTGTPATPYDVGDLWVQGASGDILTCSTAKTGSQSYNAADWVKASKYTDDTLAGQANQAAVTAQSSASTAQTAADNAKTLAESAQSTVDALRASARNLLAGTDVEFTNTYPSSGDSDKWEAFTIAPATDSEYVLTFEASSTVDGDKVRCYFYSPDTTTSVETSTGFTSTNGGDGFALVALTTTPKRYWVKWTQSATTTRKLVIVGRCSAGEGTGIVTIRQPMLVAGNIPADWTPAPDDISDKISSAQATADTAQSNASAAQSAASAAQSSADAAKSAASAAQTTADGKNKVVRSTSAPTSTSGYAAGDQWWVYSGNTVTALYLYDGSAWVNSQLGGNALSDGAVSTAKLAANAVTSAKLANGSVGSSQLASAITQSISDAQSAASAAQSTADTANSNAATAQATANAAQSAANAAQSAASAAQSTADGKNKVVRSTSAPSSTSGYSAGDQWWVYSGNTVTALYLYDGSAWVSQTLTSSVIANLDAGKITSGSISADRISAGSLTAAKLASGTITAASGVLGSASVVNATIADASISSAKIADATITNAKIADATIQSAKIANLDAGKITSGYVDADRIQAGSITGAKVAAGTITASNMVAGTLTAASGIIADAAIGSAQIIDGSIGTAEIADAAIKTAKIADAAISSAKIADASITDAKIASLDAGKITSGYVDAARIQAGTIDAGKLAADSVTSDNIVADAVTSEKLVSEAVTADKLAANSVTAVKLAAGSVTADKADIGSLSAAIVTSGKFKTSNGRMLINDDGLTAKDANGNTTVNIPSDGSTPTMVGGLSTAANGKHISISQSGDVGKVSLLDDNTELTSLTFIDDTKNSGYVYTGLYTGQNGQFLQFATLVDSVNHHPDPLTYEASFISDGRIHIDAPYGINVNGTWFARSVDELPTAPNVVGGAGTKAFVVGKEYTFNGSGSWSATSHRVFTGSKIITGTGTSEYVFLSNDEYNAIVGRHPVAGDVITFTNGDRGAALFTSAFGEIDSNDHINVIFSENISIPVRLNYCIVCND